MLMNDQNEIVIDIDERAVLVGFNDGRGQFDIDYSMAELKELTYAAGVDVVAMTIQNKSTVDAAYYIGTGKVEEVKLLAEANDANIVIFNDELSGAQIRNLEAVIGMKVIDRTTLILDIFARRATTKVSKLQVELAQLRYRLPRLTGMGASMSKTGAGIGTRGPGEQKLEIDKRRIRDRITDLSHQLQDEAAIRQTQRSQRKKNEVPVVALVGYTNAGKSSVMNRLLELTSPEEVDKRVFEKNMLFATLDTSNRKIKFEDNREFVLVDTVGFVSKLPHALVQAFKATLEEVAEADLLLHIVDVTNTSMENQIEITESVLRELGVKDKPTVYVYNKVDLMEADQVLPNREQMLKISAKTGQNLDGLIDLIKKEIFSDIVKVTMLIPYTEGQVYSYLCDKHNVLTTAYEEGGTLIEVEIDPIDLARYKAFLLSPER